MTKVGILGGTFDPPHLGHKAVAQAVLDSNQVDVVWFLPCWKHAFGKEPTEFHHRASMCYLMVRNHPEMFVSTAEAEIKSTYSVKILEYIRTGNPEKTFRLIMGTDNYYKICEWKDAKAVLSLAPPIWVARPGVENPPLEVLQCENNTSSSLVRDLLGTLGTYSDEVKKLVAPKVLGYIKQHNLYNQSV